MIDSILWLKTLYLNVCCESEQSFQPPFIRAQYTELMEFVQGRTGSGELFCTVAVTIIVSLVTFSIADCI